MNLLVLLKTGGLFAILVFIAAPAFAQSSSQSPDPPRQVCPIGYSVLGEICVDEKTGDIVLPIVPNSPRGSK